MIMFTKPSHSMGFCMWTTKYNAKNCFEAHDIFTHLGCTSFLSLTVYSQSVHLLLLPRFRYFPWSIKPCARVGSERYFWNSLSRLIYVLLIEVCMTIYELLLAESGSFTFSINTVRNFLSVVFKPSTTSLTCTGAPTPLSIIMLYAWNNIYNKYNSVSHMYWSAHPSVFSHLLILFVIKTFLFCNSSTIGLLCSDAVAEYFLISSDKK